MTTIVYTNGEIAADGRVCRAGTIVEDDRVKMITLDNGWLFLAGSTQHYDFFEQQGTIEVNQETTGDDWAGILVDKKKRVFLCASEDAKVGMCQHRGNGPASIGSGQDHAYTAIDMGATAKQAVEQAAKRDPHTGGAISVWRLGDL